MRQSDVDQLEKSYSELIELIRERKHLIDTLHYKESGAFKGGSFIRHPNRRDNLQVVEIVSLPVRYDDDYKVTHVLCWKPHTPMCRWLNMKTGRFDMKDLNGIPEQCHSDGLFKYRRK